jgi:hypothetical protein
MPLLGNDGLAPRAAGGELLAPYPETVLANDAHNTRRCSGLSAGYAWVGQRCGSRRAEDLRARAAAVLARLLRT